jgi:hypothetical protein
MASLNAVNYIIIPRRSLSMDSTNISNLVLSIFMGKEVARRGLFRLRRTSGQLGGRRLGFTARCPCIHVCGVGKLFTPSART